MLSGRPIHMYPLVVIGGGIHGTTISCVLSKLMPPAYHRVIDPHADILHQWRRNCRACGLSYLRSPMTHHLDTNPNSLARFRRHEKSNTNRDIPPFIPRYNRPLFTLFMRHAHHLYAQHALAQFRIQAYCHEITIAANHVTVETGDMPVQAQSILICTGMTQYLRYPQWAIPFRATQHATPRTASTYATATATTASAKSTPTRKSPVHYIRHVFEEDFSPAHVCHSGHVLIVGGGITALQLALTLANRATPQPPPSTHPPHSSDPSRTHSPHPHASHSHPHPHSRRFAPAALSHIRRTRRIRARNHTRRIHTPRTRHTRRTRRTRTRRRAPTRRTHRTRRCTPTRRIRTHNHIPTRRTRRTRRTRTRRTRRTPIRTRHTRCTRHIRHTPRTRRTRRTHTRRDSHPPHSSDPHPSHAHSHPPHPHSSDSHPPHSPHPQPHPHPHPSRAHSPHSPHSPHPQPHPHPRRITVLSRHTLRYADFDSDPCYLGPACLKDFDALTDIAQKKEEIAAARNRATIPPDIARRFRAACADGTCQLIIERGVRTLHRPSSAMRYSSNLAQHIWQMISYWLPASVRRHRITRSFATLRTAIICRAIPTERPLLIRNFVGIRAFC